ncbi:MAG TPA: KH domain-containing protein [Candidatus Dormibacteraeota bacterium]|nr:KH domain-containing protein [Candidatus Dormibacteraeota bacterium]
MSEIDQQFIEYVVKSLVGKPDAVHIDRRIDEKGVLLELTVDPEDLGRVIGKRGATAQSLRTLLRALGTKNDARYNLKIIDNGPLDRGQANDNATQAQPAAPAKDAAADTDTEADIVTKEEPAQTAEEPAEAAEEPATAPAAEETTTAEEPQDQASGSQDEEETSDRLAQTRKELADLDDLDL